MLAHTFVSIAWSFPKVASGQQEVAVVVAAAATDEPAEEAAVVVISVPNQQSEPSESEEDHFVAWEESMQLSLSTVDQSPCPIRRPTTSRRHRGANFPGYCQT
jgi:hypothetical protein